MIQARSGSDEAVGFMSRMRASQRLVGTFLKTPSIATVEILAQAGMDFIVIDQEHAPFDASSLDAAIFACRAMGVAAFVRVASSVPDRLLAPLDCGAMGVLIPHMDSVHKALAASQACRYATGRGYSGSVRSAGYGGGRMADTLARSDRDCVVVAQIEDAAALECVDGIAAVPGVDALFIGRGDLAVSLKADGSDSPVVWKAAQRIAEAAKRADKPVWAFAGTREEANRLTSLGATVFVYSSDQGLLRAGAVSVVNQMMQAG